MISGPAWPYASHRRYIVAAIRRGLSERQSWVSEGRLWVLVLRVPSFHRAHGIAASEGGPALRDMFGLDQREGDASASDWWYPRILGAFRLSPVESMDIALTLNLKNVAALVQCVLEQPLLYDLCCTSREEVLPRAYQYLAS